MSLGCRVDDRIRRRELSLSTTECCGRERDRRIKIHNDARLGKGDDLIGLILSHLPSEPLGQFQLNDRRDQPLVRQW